MNCFFNFFFLLILTGSLWSQSLFLPVSESDARSAISENLNFGFSMKLERTLLSTEVHRKIVDEVGPVLKDTVVWYRISTDQDQLIAIFGQAPSKHATFDFLVLISEKNHAIYKVDVIKYRENYGNQIDYDRFKKQFEGRKKPADLRFKRKIRSITGATISARSMTNAVRKVVQVLIILQREPTDD